MTTSARTTLLSDSLVPSGELLAGCARVAGIARPRSLESDRVGALPHEVITALDEERLFSLALPPALGGRGCTPGEVVGAIEELTYADASLGWTALIGQSSGFLAWMDPAEAAEVVRATAHPRVAGSMAPSGRGVPEPGPDGEPGFRISGKWSYNSGCRHAQWLIVVFVIGDPARENGAGPSGGPPPSRWALLPAESVRILPAWDVMGLRGTASDDVLVEEVWVPARRTFDPLREPARQEGPLLRHSLFTFLMTIMAGFPLGLTRRVLDDFTEVATDSGRLGSRHVLIDDPLVQSRLLRAHSEARSARLLVAEAVAGVDAPSAEDPLRARAELAAAVQNAQRVCLDTVEWAFHAAGGSAVHTSHPLQRAWRDAVTAGSHIAFSHGTVGRTARVLLRPEALVGPDALLV